MKALILEHKGLWKNMKIARMDKPKPSMGEVQVEVHAVGLNPVDHKTGENGQPKWNYPHILGLDVAGTISGIGDGGHPIEFRRSCLLSRKFN